MPDMKFHVEIKATGSVHDKDGNLISSSPVTLTGEFVGEEPTPEQIAALVEQAQVDQNPQE